MASANRTSKIHTAMILSAGLGRRLRAAPDAPPKPLTVLNGQALLAHLLDRLEAAGVAQVVVNVHHKADEIERFLQARYGASSPRYVISDERAMLLETGGGVKQALRLLPRTPFFVLNSDMFWPAQDCALTKLAAQFDAATMLACLLVVPCRFVSGVQQDDFGWQEPDKTLRFDTQGGLVYAGAQIVHPDIFDHAPAHPKFSFTQLWRGLTPNRLYGYPMMGDWMHIGTPEGLAQARARLVPPR